MSKRSAAAILALSLSLAATTAIAQFPQPDGGGLEPGVLPARWMSQQPKCMEIPDWQVHEYNKDFYILRQSPCTDYEKPFIFLFFGNDKALLVDTGSRNGNLVPTLTATIHHWLTRNHRTSIPLTVVHTHEHEDHTWGDRDIAAMQDPAIPVTLVKSEVEATKKLYNISAWPTDTGTIDLGGRVLDAIPIPGHSLVSIAFYDRRTGVLLGSDSVYPGRLYVRDFAAFQSSTERLIAFTEGKPVAHILGNHIEQSSTPFLDYPVGTMYQPQEHELALSRGSLLEIESALLSMHGTPRRLALRDLSIWPAGVSISTGHDKELYEKHVKDEKAKMWDHTRP